MSNIAACKKFFENTGHEFYLVEWDGKELTAWKPRADKFGILEPWSISEFKKNSPTWKDFDKLTSAIQGEPPFKAMYNW